MSLVTKRQSVIAVLTAMCGLMSDRAKTQTTASSATGLFASITMPKAGVSFPLDSFTEYDFYIGDEHVRMTPAEILAVLKS